MEKKKKVKPVATAKLQPQPRFVLGAFHDTRVEEEVARLPTSHPPHGTIHSYTQLPNSILVLLLLLLHLKHVDSSRKGISLNLGISAQL